jgi:putative ABC transport system permease protein
MDSFLNDLRFAARQLAKDRGFLATAGLTLALCIGANTAIFSVVNSVLLKPLPVPEPDRLVTMWNAYPGAVAGGADVRGSNGAPDYFDRRALKDVFEDVASYSNRGCSLDLDGTPQRVRAQQVTPSYFGVLRARAALGRTFTEAEGETGNDQVVVLSDGLWRQLYGGKREALGSELRIDGKPRTVIGVMPAGFGFLREDVRLWTPLVFTEEQRGKYHSNSWQMIARLAPGVTLAQAQAPIDALNAANMDKLPDIKPLLIDAGFHTPVVPLEEDFVRDVRGVLYLLWGGVAFVLLIGCVNVANLMLVRSTARARELATRFALGARRGRIVRQLLTESVLLTLGGGAAGLAVGLGGLQALRLLGIENLPRAGQIHLDATAVVFTFGLTLVVAALVALIPLSNTLRVSLSSAFREGGRTGTAGRGQRLVRKALVAGQVALALVLLAGAGLLMASFRQLLAVDPGFRPGGVLTGTVVLDDARYPKDADIRNFAAGALSEIRALPGVTAAGITSQIPFGGGYSDSVIFAEGHVMRPGESAISPSQNVITPGYFEAMGMRLIAGRTFDASDTPDGRQVAIVDEQLARRFWPDGDALGKRMWQPTSAADFSNPEKARYYDVVGIVAPIRLRGLAAGVDDTGAYYFPLSQNSRSGLDFAIKTSGDPQALVGPVRSLLARLDPEMPLFDVHTMDERITDSLTDRRTPMLLTAIFSALALLLAAVGIYGTLAYLVQFRTKEIGIRTALGSGAAAIFRMVLSEGLTILVPGLALGFAGALALRRAIESQLYVVSALDPRVLTLVVAVLGAVALAACLVPARRATRIDPVVALAEE